MVLLEVEAKHGSITWPLIVSGVFVGWVIVQVLYNLLLHPLAKYPGPFLAKISSWPSFYHAVKGDRHIWLWQCFQIYGDKIRIGPQTMLFNKPEAYADIYNLKANVKKNKTYDMWQRNKDDVNTLNCSDRVIHARKRKVLNTVFTDKSIASASDFIIKHVDRWNELTATGEGWSEPINAAKWTDCLIFDLMGDLCFGKSFETKEAGENRFKTIPDAILSYMQFMHPVSKSPLVDLMMWLKPRGLDSLLDKLTPPDIKHYYDFLDDAVTKRTELENNLTKSGREQERRKDMFHYLFHAKDETTGQPAFSRAELISEAHLLIIAGSDTSSTSIAALFFYLTHYPRVYSKLVALIRNSFDSVDEIQDSPKLTSCLYLRACIDEAMRLSPPGPSELSRTILQGGLVVDGDYFPEGVNVGTAGWTNGHNEVNYGDPEVFRPERWIEDEETGVTAAEVARVKACFHPFSSGPGNCVGQQLARLEMMLVVARTIFRLDFRLLEGSTLGEGKPELGWGRRLRNVYQLDDAYIAIRNGPMVQFRKRQS